jgi:hypothetical protein
VIDGKQYLIAAVAARDRDIDLLQRRRKIIGGWYLDLCNQNEALEEEVELLRVRLQIRGLLAPHRPEL